MRTGIEFEGSETFHITLVDGAYRYYCDVHYPLMLGSFSVPAESVPPPSPLPRPVPRLFASVGPGAAISLRNAAGRLVTSPRAGTYSVLVRDRSARDNFHLVGPALDRRTIVAGRGSYTWKVRFLKGARYTYRSDAHRTLARTFRAV